MIRWARCRRSALSDGRRGRRHLCRMSQAARLRCRCRERRRRALVKQSRWYPSPLPRRRSSPRRCRPNRPMRKRLPKWLRPRLSKQNPRRKSSRRRKCRRCRGWSELHESSPRTFAGTTTTLNKKRPGFPGRFRVDQETRTALRGGFPGRAIDHLRSLSAGGNRNVAGLLGLGDLADEIDVEQAVLERSALHHDEIGKLEYPLEGARRDAAIQQLGLVLGV